MSNDSLGDYFRRLRQEQLDELSKEINNGLYVLIDHVLGENGGGEGTLIGGRDIRPGVVEVMFSSDSGDHRFIIEYEDMIPTSNTNIVLIRGKVDDEEILVPARREKDE
jgi:hypothetical protein